jgi:ribosome-binding protein aMBF1 (putative translation factor)
VCKLYLNPEDAKRCKTYADKDEWIRAKRYKGSDIKGVRKTIGQIIQDMRKANGWTIQELSEMIDTHRNTLSSWEEGRSLPNPLFLVSMAEVFECTIDEICGVG